MPPPLPPRHVLALSLTLTVLVALVWAQSRTFSYQQRQELGGLIREYLVANPEVLQEALASFETRQEQSSASAKSEVIRAEADVLYRSTADLVLGNPAGDVTIVEFLDYNCPYCKRAATDLKNLIQEDGLLRVVLKDLPVLGLESHEASRMALAAKMQLEGTRIGEFHERLLEGPGRATAPRAKQIAREMGIDLVRLDQDAAIGGRCHQAEPRPRPEARSERYTSLRNW